MNRIELRTQRHPIYGDIPLIRRTQAAKTGEVVEWWEYDLTFRPPLPRGAVRGDPAKQVFCTAHHVPKYFYVDERRRCIQCESEFSFTAEEQQFWYETLKFNFHSVAVRCRDCRRHRRSEAALRNHIAAARASVAQTPHDPAALLALAESLVRYHQRAGAGSLNDAVSAARKARALWPDALESWFWEGMAHHQARRRVRARDCLERFVERSASTRRLHPLRVEAQQVLAGP
jgi:hypothetical protein